MLNWPAKDPDEVLDYRWEPALDAGDAIASITLTRVAGDVITDSDDNDASGITLVLSGGTDGTNMFRGLATTTGGRTFEEYIRLVVSSILQPEREPLTLKELKQRADITRDDIDAVLTSLIRSGREWVETYTGLTVEADSVVQRFDRFSSPMSLLVAPEDDVTVSYIDADGEQAEVSGARVIATSRPARLLPPAAASWPDRASYVTVTVPGVPETFKAAITLYVRAIHEDGALSEPYRQALEALCFPYRMMVLA